MQHVTARKLAFKVVSFDAPVVVVAAEDDGAKLDPTRKVVVYGSVEAQDTGPYTLRWDQVRYSQKSAQGQERGFDPLRSKQSVCFPVYLAPSPRHFVPGWYVVSAALPESTSRESTIGVLFVSVRSWLACCC